MPGSQRNWGKPWTAEENETVRQLFLLGWGRSRIAKQFGVTPDAIAGKLTQLKLRRRDFPLATHVAAE